MKKTLCLLIALLTAASLLACGQDSANPPATTVGATTTAQSGSQKPQETTKNPILDKVTTEKPTTEKPVTDQPVTDDPNSGDVEVGTKTFVVSTADELIAAIDAINSGEAPENSNITLISDILLSERSGVSDYEPLYRYSGTFDGGGYTILDLNWTFVMANGGGNMPNANQPGSYVLEDLPDGTAGRYARGTVALLVLQLNEGGCVKNLTVEDSSLTIQCSFNKNYQMYIAGVVGHLNGGTLEGVELINVDVTVPANVNYNQGFPGYAAPLVARVTGESVMTNCEADADCTVDTSANVMFNAGRLVGVVEVSNGGSLSGTGCTTEAVCIVHANPTKDVLAYSGEGIILGGTAGGAFGFAE